jgi:hypothetical protein
MKLTLCGSLKFEPYWHEANKQLGLAGHICYSVMTFPSIEGAKSWYTEDQKWTLDLAHLAKIEESDGVVMLNIDSYLGESSLRELQWARMRNKYIYWTMQDSRARMDNEGWARSLIVPKYGQSAGEWLELIKGVAKNG